MALPELVYRDVKGSNLTPEEGDANMRALAQAVGATEGVSTVHPYYHFHGFAGGQLPDDSTFNDLAGLNHAVRGANLSISQLWTTAAGYASTIDPASGVTDSVLRIPPVNFDYSAGEKLIVWWLGKCAAEAGAAYMLGDGSSTSVRGWAVLVNTNQKAQIVLSGAAQGYGGQSAVLPFDGGLHSFGFVLDGQAKKYAFWVDESIDTIFATNGYGAFASGADFDTKTTATVNLGTAVPAPGSSSNSIATATRALVILRLPASYTVPPISSVTATFQQLRANPGKLILKSAF